MRAALVIASSWLGLACTGTEPLPRAEPSEPPPPAPVVMPRGSVLPPPPPSPCPAGTERRERGGDLRSLEWWCARGEVSHGPFLEHAFDERSRTWYEIHGEHFDGQRHGMIYAEGPYVVEHSGRSRVFRRELHAHDRLIRSNEATLRVELDATHSVVTRRFTVSASGLAALARWEEEPDVIGTLDVDVSATWSGGPADADPSVLRVEVSTPTAAAPVRADTLLYPVEDPEPPAIASSLPPGYVPTASLPWSACDPGGCALELEVTLRWLAAGPGRLEANVVARAVPDTWPEAAPIDVRSQPALDESSMR